MCRLKSRPVACGAGFRNEKNFKAIGKLFRLRHHCIVDGYWNDPSVVSCRSFDLDADKIGLIGNAKIAVLERTKPRISHYSKQHLAVGQFGLDVFTKINAERNTEVDPDCETAGAAC
jgi:hypothetical protein